MKFAKIRGGALQLTLFISVVIALLLGSFILLVHVHNKFAIQTSEQKQVIQVAENKLQYATNHSISLNDSIVFSEDSIGVQTTLYKTYWGLFEKIKATTVTKHKTFNKIALQGGNYATTGTALYLGTNNSPLVISGTTRITGNAYLSSKGIKQGSIAGQVYTGDQLIYGNSYTSSGLLKLPKELITYITTVSEQFKRIPHNQFINLNTHKEFRNSFKEKVQYLYSQSNLYLEDQLIEGNIIVQSATSIYVTANTQLKHVILIAPEIEFEEGFSGDCQAIATNHLIVNKNCSFSYPSALWVYKEQLTKMETANSGKENMLLVVEGGCVVKGIIGFYSAQSVSRNYQTQVYIGEDTKLYGELYCTHNTELEGMVLGSVYTQNFICHQGSTVYQNNLYNGVINNDSIHKAYGGLYLNEENPKTLVSWLY